MNSEMAPILITVYNRLNHFKRCISSLAENAGAKDSDLIIAIDAPYREQDIQVNQEIIDFSKGITGFKSISLICRKENLGVDVNAKLAICEVFENYSAMVRAEDDNVFSPYFLQYINDGLRKYENEPRIFGICGYNLPYELDDGHNCEVFLRGEYLPYGVGIWKNKYQMVDRDSSSFLYSFLNPFKVRLFNNAVGDHVFYGLTASKLRSEVYADFANTYHIYKNDMLCLFPLKTLVRNIGQDGTGAHSGVNNILQVQEIWERGKPIAVNLDCIEESIPHREARNKFYKKSFKKKPLVYILYLLLFAKDVALNVWLRFVTYKQSNGF